MKFFQSSCYQGSFTDAESDFYFVYRNLFIEIEKQEFDSVDDTEAVDGSPLTKTSFGSQSSLFEEIKPFYNKFSSFSTCRSFRWLDKWNLNEAQNRQIRRAMEKENKKAREDGRRDFNEAVRNLTAFIKKRDPRIKVKGVD